MTSPVSAQDLLSSLTDRQREAAEHVEGPLLIVAGPGSGKTRVMAHRVAYLIGCVGVPSYRILAVTFTNKAARELRERCELLLGGRVPGLQVRTFHAFCSQFLRVEGSRAGLDPGFSIYDADDQQRLLRGILDGLEVDTKRITPRAVLGAISDAKNTLIGPEAYQPGVASYFEEIVSRAYPVYERRLRDANAVDFDDLLLITHRILERDPDVLDRYQDRYEHLLIDEFQDTNPLQFGLARFLGGKYRNICVVGDPNQSIYSWRHADPRNMLEFNKVYPDTRIVNLDQNYRSTQTILEAAASLIANNQGRLRNELWTENATGAPVVVAEAYSEEEEAELVLNEAQRLASEEGVDPGDIAVMYRINAQSRAVEVACNRHALPYQLVGGLKFYERREIRDLISFLRLIVNPADDVALERIINTPARGISQKSVDTIREVARSRGLSMWETVEGAVPEPEKPARESEADASADSVGAPSPPPSPAQGRGRLDADAARQRDAGDPTQPSAGETQGETGPTKSSPLAGEDSGEGDRAAATSAEVRQDLAGRLNTRAMKAVADFAAMVRYLADRSHVLSPVELIDLTLERTGYKRLIQEDQERGEERWENLLELRGTAEEYDGPEPRQQLMEFLENAALVSDVDRVGDDGEGSKLTLITLHQAKGLEFDTVFMIGLEEGLLPHSRSMESEPGLEEERRLCYVGMTRAKKRLYMLRAFRRAFRGSRSFSMPSRFLMEIPTSCTVRQSNVAGRSPTPRGRESIQTPMDTRRAAAAPAPARAAPRGVWHTGDRVKHHVFGTGVIVSAKEASGDLEVTVAFEGHGVKRLLASFAQLQKASNGAGGADESEEEEE